MKEADWCEVLASVTSGLDGDIRLGLRGLMTEDRLRWLMIEALVRGGVEAASLFTEVRVPGVGPVDLVVGTPPAWQVELKFPRDPGGKGENDTQTTGELMRDFARLAACPATEGRLAVQVIPDRLQRHLRRRPDVDWVMGVGERFAFDAGILDGLKKTVRVATGIKHLEGAIEARCIFVGQADDLTVLGYVVEPMAGQVEFE
ncbi:MAG: hypothetical protein EP330_00885 [Deltaproteobacteria bacterium]|nr:MAG: hypothetical protein EP330_00885 [Deltaproteobacteria bacterium]